MRAVTPNVKYRLSKRFLFLLDGNVPGFENTGRLGVVRSIGESGYVCGCVTKWGKGKELYSMMMQYLRFSVSRK